MPFNDQSNPLNYPANSRDAFRRFRVDRAPTSSDFQNFKIGDFWIDTSAEELYFLVDKSGTALWILLSSGPGPGVESLTGNTGGPVPADGAENINIIGTGNVTVAGNPGTNTLTISDTGSNPETLTGNTGGAVGPDGSNNINFVGMSPFTVAGNPGTNTLTIENDGNLAENYPTDSGTAIPASDTLNVFGGTGISTSGVGNTITIDNSGDVATQYTEDSGTAVPSGNNLNVLGGTSIKTTGATDTITIDLDADVANKYTADSGTAIPALNNLNVFGSGGLFTTATGSTVTIHSNSSSLFYNLGITFSGGTFSITAANGTALSSSNKAFIKIASKSSPGTSLWIPIDAPQSFIDDTGASTIAGNLFGLTTGIAHAEAIPFFIYAVLNDAEDEIAFMISRYFKTKVSPVSAKIGQSGSAVANTQGSFFSLKSITTTEFESNPVSLLGSFRMTMNASDDWSVSALTPTDGIGEFNQETPFSMSRGQFGAKANNYFIDNGGTAPVLAGTVGLSYNFGLRSLLELGWSLSATAGGIGAVTLLMKTPFISGTGFQPRGASDLQNAGNAPTFIGHAITTSASNSISSNGVNATVIRAYLNTDLATDHTLRGTITYVPEFV